MIHEEIFHQAAPMIHRHGWECTHDILVLHIGGHGFPSETEPPLSDGGPGVVLLEGVLDTIMAMAFVQFVLRGNR